MSQDKISKARRAIEEETGLKGVSVRYIEGLGVASTTVYGHSVTVSFPEGTEPEVHLPKALMGDQRCLLGHQRVIG